MGKTTPPFSQLIEQERRRCTHGQDLPYTGGELSGLVSKRLNKW
jgi:hypothetical protein